MSGVRRPMDPENIQKLQEFLGMVPCRAGEYKPPKPTVKDVLIGLEDPPKPPWDLVKIFRRSSDQRPMVLGRCRRCGAYHPIDGREIIEGKTEARCPCCSGTFPIELED